MSIYVQKNEGFGPRFIPAENDASLQPYADGYCAWVAGERDEANNPYRPFTVAAGMWLEGFDEASVDYPTRTDE
jgi:hypothetical protein